MEMFFVLSRPLFSVQAFFNECEGAVKVNSITGERNSECADPVGSHPHIIWPFLRRVRRPCSYLANIQVHYNKLRWLVCNLQLYVFADDEDH